MTYCDHEAEQIECPEICSEQRRHEHWRCPQGHGWLVYPDNGGATWYDLTQPARLIYPVTRR